jgi:immunity protein 7 of polymorphic toxin system
MYEFHLWTVIRYHPHDTNLNLQHNCLTTCEDYFEKHQSLKQDNYKLIRQNGNDTFLMSGLHNHFALYVLELFKWIGQTAPGSYGLLYISDEEDQYDSQNFQVYVMRKGTVSRQKDCFLSPRIPVIEDRYDTSRND